MSAVIHRKRKLYLLLAGGLLMLLLAGSLALLLRRAPDNTPMKLWSVAFSPDGKTLVTTGGPDAPDSQPQMGELVFWNAANGRRKRILPQPAGMRRAVFSPDGKFVATADFAGTTKLLDPATGKTKATLTPHSSQVNAVAISSDSKLIAGGSFDGSITLWDGTGKEVGTLLAPKEKIVNLAISPDKQELVAGCREGNAYLFDLAQRGSPKVLKAYVGPPSYWSGIEAVAFAPDGESFVTGGMNLRLWEAGSGKLIREFERPSGARMNCLAFSPDGHSLAGIDRDGWLALWDPSTGERTACVQAHTGPSFGLAFSPNGQRLATVSRTDFAVKIWDRYSLNLVATFRRAKAPR
jgi:WD40 repeat protein